MTRSRVLAAALCSSLLAACDLDFLNGSSGTCDDLACAWELEQGSLERTGTWNENEYAYALSSTPTRLSRSVSVRTSPGCIRLSYLAEIAASADLQAQLDFGDDGSTELTTPLPATGWTRREVVLRAPADYRKLRVRLNKTGAGSAKILLLDVSGGGTCSEQPPVVLQNGASCMLDSTCASSRCVLGQCEACGPGGCVEGEGCRTDSECMDGACAAQVCRACAKTGTCGAGERCSAPAHCSQRSCSLGALPSLSTHPQQDGTCGECGQDSDCGAAGEANKCVLGRCAECATDADCDGGRVCRYADLYDAQNRACVPKLISPLPRGALCEQDMDCADELRCGAGAARAKRCGFACGHGECAPGEVCVVPGAASLPTTPPTFSLLPSYSEPPARIATCFTGVARAEPCIYSQQCARSVTPMGCCLGRCFETDSEASAALCGLSTGL